MFIIHLGISGFPIGNAPIQRIRLTFKALRLSGINTLIINKHSVHKSSITNRLNLYQGIPYVFTSYSHNRHDSYLLRNLNKLSGYLGELLLLIKKRKKIHAALFYESSFGELVYYRILSKLLNFKLILHYVELRSSIPQRQSLFNQLNDFLFDNYCFYFCDGIIGISEFLIHRANTKNKSLSLIKIPAICDFDEFNLKSKLHPSNYLMYCGSILYFPVIEFVLELFCKLKKSNLYNGTLLFAIGSGVNEDISFKELEEKINKSEFKNSILLKRNVPHHELIQLYLESELLIVPLRNTLQDIAGFHHKVGEYSAARKPIISTNIGELKYYFIDGVSAILAEEYSLESYLAKLKEVLASKDLLDNIGEEGYKVGISKFNYKTYAFKLKDFLEAI